MVLSALNLMRWKSPKALTHPPFERHETFRLAEVAAMNPLLVQLLHETGIPELEGTTREKTVALLRMAAEIEHSFVVQYLYGAFSLDRNDQTGSLWNSVLFGIAKEEIGHLDGAKSLSLAGGNSPHRSPILSGAVDLPVRENS